METGLYALCQIAIPYWLSHGTKDILIFHYEPFKNFSGATLFANLGSFLFGGLRQIQF